MSEDAPITAEFIDGLRDAVKPRRAGMLAHSGDVVNDTAEATEAVPAVPAPERPNFTGRVPQGWPSDMALGISRLNERLTQAEHAIPDAGKVAQEIGNLRADLDRLTQFVQQQAQQRTPMEMQIERQTRAAALELAIKAMPEAMKGTDAGGSWLIEVAASFHTWLRGSAEVPDQVTPT